MTLSETQYARMVDLAATVMQIYILRHGIAEVAMGGMSDADRALTAEGRKKLRAVLKAAKAMGVEPDLILTSPYLRALQTAEVAAEVFGFQGKMLEVDALRPGGSPRDVWDEIREHPESSSVVVSGHEPLLSSLAAFLLGTPSLWIDLKKGSLMRIDMDRTGSDPRGVLCWYYTPKIAAARRTTS